VLVNYSAFETTLLNAGFGLQITTHLEVVHDAPAQSLRTVGNRRRRDGCEEAWESHHPWLAPDSPVLHGEPQVSACFKKRKALNNHLG
jgi:hypothetical protein